MKDLMFNVYADDIEMEGQDIKGVFSNYYYVDTDRFVTNSNYIFYLNQESEKIINDLKKGKSINEIVKNLNKDDYFIYIKDGYVILEWNCNFIHAYGKYKWKIIKINFASENI